MGEHDFFEMAKSGGLFFLLAYMIYSDKQAKDKDRAADVKRSEATSLLGKAINNLVDYLNRKG